MVFRMIDISKTGTFLGRLWTPAENGPSIITVRKGLVIDITSPIAPTVRDVCEMDDPADFVANADGRDIGSVEEISSNACDLDELHFLAPCDLQAVKACGVTFAGSMVERVIEEQAAGDPDKAKDIRERIGARIGASLAISSPDRRKPQMLKTR